MNQTRTTILRTFRIGLFVFVAVIIAAYAVWRSLDYIRGPQVIVTSPADWSSISATTTQIIGRASRIKEIKLNGKTISINEQGDFSETIVLFPGTNIITVSAGDQFGRNISEELRIYRPQ